MANDKGWIKAYRSIKDHWISHDHRAFHLWFYLLMEVNHVESKTKIEGNLTTIKQGQTYTSIDKLSKGVNITWRKTKELLEEFEADEMITITPISHGILLTVCNYQMYQGTLPQSRAERRENSRTDSRTDSRAERRQYKKNKNDINNDIEKDKKAAQRRLNLWEGAPE